MKLLSVSSFINKLYFIFKSYKKNYDKDISFVLGHFIRGILYINNINNLCKYYGLEIYIITITIRERTLIIDDMILKENKIKSVGNMGREKRMH